MMKPITKLDNRRLILHSLLFFTPLASLIIVVLWTIYSAEERSNRTLIEGHEKIHVTELTKLIINDFSGVISNLLFLADQHELQRMLEGETGEKSDLTSNLLSFSENNDYFDQVRFLDDQGMELIRINQVKGKSMVVPENQLQSKLHRYYFQDTFKLSRGEIYVSPLDLNIEKGEIEYPLKPMIRFGTPVFDKEGRKRGAIVLNYLGANMLAKLETLSTVMSGQIMLLNSSGYWLKGTNAEDEWGFMHKERQNVTFGNRYPASWKAILANDSGQFYQDGELFSFATVYPLSSQIKSTNGSPLVRGPSQRILRSKQYYWKVVSIVSQKLLTKKVQASRRRILLLSVVLLNVIAIISLLLTRSRLLKKLTEEELKATQFTVDHTEEMIFWSDASANIIYANEICCRRLGYTREEMMSKTIFDFDQTISRASWIEHWEQLKNKRSITFESLFLPKEGKEIPVEMITNFIHYKGKEINGAFARDITEKKQIEKDLKLDEERFKAIITLNQMKKRDELELLGYAVEKAIHLSTSTYGYLHFVSEDRRNLEHRIWSKEVIKNCKLTSSKFYPINKVKIWATCISQKETIIHNNSNDLNKVSLFPADHLNITRHLCTPILDGEKVVALIGLSNKNTPYDRTDVKQLNLLMNSVWRIIKDRRAEEALAVSEKKFRHLINNIDAGVIVYSPDGSAQMVNEKALRLFNLSHDQVLGNTPIDPGWELIREDNSTIGLQDYPANQVITTRAPLNNFVIGVKPTQSASPTWLLFNGYPEFSESAEIHQVTITFIDITERKKVAEALQQRINAQIEARQEILQVMEDLNQAKKEAEDRFIALKREVAIRTEMEAELRNNVAELEQFRKLAVGREERMIKLKEEINTLRSKTGNSPKYKIVS